MEYVQAAKAAGNNVVHGDWHNPSSGQGKTVLITGGSGFVAAHVLNAFLSRGYNVRTTVRSQETAEKVKKTHSKYLSKLSFAIVKDVALPGGHDEAVKGVDGVSS
jgi:nucleoside-diphosphate-sugar epimerase